MANPVIMPRQGQSVESCVITGFGKKLGEKVSVGDILFSYETDKATFDEEAKTEGTLLAVFFSEGDDVPCLETVCVIGTEGEDFSSYMKRNEPVEASGDDKNSDEAEAKSAPALVSAADNSAVGIPISQINHEFHISPRARKAAERGHVNPVYAIGTGPEGRIIERDILALASSGKAATSAASAAYLGATEIQNEGTGIGGRFTIADTTAKAESASQKTEDAAQINSDDLNKTSTNSQPPTYIDEPLTNMRKLIAKAMYQSLSEMAQLTHNASYDATDILAMRKLFKEKGEAYGLSQITINDILLYAVSRTLAMPEHRALNAHFLGDTMRYFDAVHLGVAVDTPRGLMVPTIFYANKKSLKELSAEAKDLAKACISGKIMPDYLQGGTFTVSNLGALEIESFTPVINPPQTGILGINTIVHRPREDGSIYPAMTLSLTYDHRALDGAPASRFLRDLKHRLEQFSMTLALG